MCTIAHLHVSGQIYGRSTLYYSSTVALTLNISSTWLTEVLKKYIVLHFYCISLIMGEVTFFHCFNISDIEHQFNLFDRVIEEVYFITLLLYLPNNGRSFNTSDIGHQFNLFDRGIEEVYFITLLLYLWHWTSIQPGQQWYGKSILYDTSAIPLTLNISCMNTGCLICWYSRNIFIILMLWMFPLFHLTNAISP